MITGSSLEGDTATANVTLTNTGFSGVVSELVKKSMTGELAKSAGTGNYDVLTPVLAQANQSGQTISQDVTLHLVPDGDEWKIKLDDETENILIGNLANFF